MRHYRLAVLITLVASAVATAGAQVSDVLSFLMSPEQQHKASGEGIDGVLASIAESDNTAAILAAIAEPSVKESAALASLNYISHAYSNRNFHSSGLTGTGNGFSTAPAHPGYLGALYTPEWGRITSGFGYRTSFKRMHKGIDIAMCTGDTVRAPLPGRVSRIGYEAKGYGKYIVLTHEGGMETRYAHLTAAMVSAGDYVQTGQPIALSGNTGNSTGPHLHFETRYLGSAIDPRSVFDFTTGYMKYDPRIPQAPRKRSTYIVRQGDTLKSIARKTGISPMRLSQLNFINEDYPLEPGRMLKLR